MTSIVYDFAAINRAIDPKRASQGKLLLLNCVACGHAIGANEPRIKGGVAIYVRCPNNLCQHLNVEDHG